MGQIDIDLMNAVNAELIDVADALTERRVDGLSVPHIHEFSTLYVYEDPSDLLTFFKTDPADKDFRCPFVQRPYGGWNPDFENRYFTEDIPIGLRICKGIADLVQVPTPATDEIISWAQKHIGKEYIVEGNLCGKDIAEKRASQAFGIDLQALLQMS